MPLSNNSAGHFNQTLFEPLKIGDFITPNRIFMAPMTRLRSIEPGDIPSALMAEYYSQRASAGLIITEATNISAQAKGYAGSPGIHTDEQIAAWKVVTDAIHDKGGLCCVQLWHTGRNSHTSLQPGNAAPVAPSAIPSHSRTSLKDASGNIIRVESSMPRALNHDEIKGIINDFRQAVINARQAGFDFVELHAAHGYLLHQFLSPASNQRTDEYGGSIDNRTRFILEVVDAAIDAWDSKRIGIRLFPSGPFKGILSAMGAQEKDINTQADSLHLIRQLASKHMAYLHLSEPDWTGGTPLTDSFRQEIRDAWPGVIIAAGAYTQEKAQEMLEAGFIDAVAFGRAYIANPDLVNRFRWHSRLNIAEMSSWYGGGEQGYIDYPCFEKTCGPLA